MIDPAHTTPRGFHEGELAVQRQAGVARDAARLEGMLDPTQLRSGVSRFLAERTFAAITARDLDGVLWISPLTGPPGFLQVIGQGGLNVRALPIEGDPLHHLPASQPVGLLVVEFATRRRLRINGTLSATGSDGMRIDVEQVYGNCPQYIQSRHLQATMPGTPRGEPVRRAATLNDGDIDLIRRSDTFLIGTTHPVRGNDASHRGGPPGFVRVEDGRLWWPDYSGNNMFNTLGNLRVDATAALLVCDFTTGDTLHLSGRGALEWTRQGAPGDDDRTGRRVHFLPRHLVAGRLLRLQAAEAPGARRPFDRHRAGRSDAKVALSTTQKHTKEN